MPQRSAHYKASKGVEAIIPAPVVDQMVMRVMDEVYDKNMVLREKVYSRRFQIWTVGGKPAINDALLDAIHNRPEEVGYLLPIVSLYEENGEDVLSVVLHTEILEHAESNFSPSILNLALQPPNITVDDMIQEARRRKNPPPRGITSEGEPP